MVTFNHLDRGTSETEWVASPRWSQVGEFVLEGIDRLVVVAAHPDDETLGVSGLMARADLHGIRTCVIVATDGEGSHPHSPTRSRDELRLIRRIEVKAALRIVSPSAELDLLEIPDGQIRDEPDRLRRRLREVIGSRGGQRTLIVAPWREDGHRDHVAAGAVAAAIALQTGTRLLEYPIWMWHWAAPEDPRVPWAQMLRLDLTPSEHAAKEAATNAHLSQTRPLSDAHGDEALLNPEVQAHFARNFETFIQTRTVNPEVPLPSLTEGFFDEFYAGKIDPWGFESRWYEERKRALTVAALPRARFASALEVGCSTGMLTRDLAERCERLLAIDIAAAPIETARERLKDYPRVEFAQMRTPQHWPDGRFDLIVLSEIGYYWDETDLRHALDRAVRTLTRDGIIIACHWRHDVPEYPLSGDQVHAALLQRTDLALFVRHREEDFLLDVFSRPPAVSVARETGLV